MERHPVARRPDAPDGPVAHLVDLVKHTVPPLHPAGVPFVAVPAAVAVLAGRRRWLRIPAGALALSSAAFFRHPSRVPPTEPGVVVAPADGEVTLVDTAVPPAELGLGSEPLPRISTFLSVFDVHVQRVPVAGTVEVVQHSPGKFLSADLPEASTDNERTSMRIRTADGHAVGVVQIAGLVARRIVCDAKVGDQLTLGDTYGLIRFGSRVDVYLPAGSQQCVAVGQRAVGAETVVAKLS